MRLPILLAILFVAIGVVVDWLIYVRLRKVFRSRVPSILHIALSAILVVGIIVVICLPKRNGDNHHFLLIMKMLYAYFTIYLPKYVYAIFYMVASIPRIFRKKICKPLEYVGCILGVSIFLLMFVGALFNINRVNVERVEIGFPNLPNGFEGYKIVQISDFHTGTYDGNTKFPQIVVDSINALNPDLVVFTGDIVNRQSDELVPYVDVLSKIKAPVYSILGNHDYGDYRDWKTPELKEANMQMLYRLQKEMGWQLLNNESVAIYNGNDSIILIGVENWGDPPFTKYGNLKESYSDLNDGSFKILMSHNPAHWRSEVLPETNIDLTLSGHTHAMQTEFTVGSYRWSPSSMRYKEWGGLYAQDAQKLYVNIGLGEVGIPTRIGSAIPEITLITLHKEE